MENSAPIDIPGKKEYLLTASTSHPEIRIEQMLDYKATTTEPSYNSPTLSRASNDFLHVMVKLHPCNSMYEFPGYHGSSSPSTPESQPMSMSCPVGGNLVSSLSPKHGRGGRSTHKVTFDETTITVAAELGESAARFRSQFRGRNRLTNASHLKFGSKNISYHHVEENDEEENNSTLPSNDQNNNKGKSIFEVCNYSAYGRYT